MLEELAKIKSGDVVLPPKSREGHPNGTVRLPCVTEPDEAQKVLLHRLGVHLPRRLPAHSGGACRDSKGP